MIARTAGLDPDHGRGKLLEKRHHLLAPKLLAQNRHLGGIHPVKLENVLRRVHPNSANLFHGRFPLSEICNDLILARLMPSGAVHSNRWIGPAGLKAAETLTKLPIPYFHPSGPSEFGYLIQRKSLIYQSELACGAGRTRFHPVNPG